MKAKPRKIRRVAIFPALLTLGNLLCGFGAIYYLLMLKQDIPASKYFDAAAMLVFLAMIFDMLDGRVARYTKSASNFGAQLDSLADVVSFGVVPALLMFRIVNYANISLPVKFVWIVAAFYVACAALRLARFNAETTIDENAHQFFVGLPTPGAGILIAGLSIVYAKNPGFSYPIAVALLILTILGAALMVSRFRYAHFLNRFTRAKPFIQLIEIVLVVLLVSILHLSLAITLLVLLYVLSGPLSFIRKLIFGRRKSAVLSESAVAEQKKGNFGMQEKQP